MWKFIKDMTQAVSYTTLMVILLAFFAFYLIPLTLHAIDQLRVFLGLITQSQLQFENLLTFP